MGFFSTESTSEVGKRKKRQKKKREGEDKVKGITKDKWKEGTKKGKDKRKRKNV